MRTILVAALVLAAPLALASSTSDHRYTGFAGNASALVCPTDKVVEQTLGHNAIPDPPSAACVHLPGGYVWFRAYDDASARVPLLVQLTGPSAATITQYVCDGGAFYGGYNHITIAVVDPFYSFAACGEAHVATSGFIRVSSG